jgi:membrane-associated phospholipid phosphatase
VREPTTVEHGTTGRWAALVIAAVVAIGCGLVAATGDVPAWEVEAFHAVNDLPDTLRTSMWVFQLAGILVVPLIVACIAIAWRRYRLAIALVLFVPLKLIVEHLVVKALVERQRPGTSICDLDPSCGEFRDVPLAGLSFVSGHAVVTWGIAALVWPYLGRTWRGAVVAIAVLNGVARVYLGAHNPLDVVGGAAVGVAVGVLLTIVVGAPRAESRSTEQVAV